MQYQRNRTGLSRDVYFVKNSEGHTDTNTHRGQSIGPTSRVGGSNYSPISICRVGGSNKEGRGSENVSNPLIGGLVINWGGGKMRDRCQNLTKNCMKLKEIGHFLKNSKIIFPKIVVWGGYNNLKLSGFFSKKRNLPPGLL